MGLNRRIDVRKCADSARNGASGNLHPGGHKPFSVACHLRMGLCKLQTERRRLGMNAVAASDADSVLVLVRSDFESGKQCVEIVDQNIRRTHELNIEAGVEHIGRGHALMDEARFGPHMLGQMRQERDDIVLDLTFDGIDPFDVEIDVPCLPHRIGRGLGNDAQIRLCVASMGFDLEPDAELGFG